MRRTNQFFITINGIKLHFRKNRGKHKGITLTIFEEVNDIEKSNQTRLCLIKYLELEGFLDLYKNSNIYFASSDSKES